MEDFNRPKIVYCTPDPTARGQNPTVSFYCPSCTAKQRRKRVVRHTHGNPARYSKPGEVVGERHSHCDSGGFGGQYILVIGPEPFTPPTRAK
jgi:hypothetical protein